MKPLELPLHPHLETIFGYNGSARRVVFYWEPWADRLMYDDGNETGSANSWAYLIWAGHPSVKPHLPQVTGSLLMLERTERKLYVLSRSEALEALEGSGEAHQQSPKTPVLPLREAQRLLADFVQWLSSPSAKAA
ncbi:hypothetical protein [Meiothermus granaticius]|uniref:Uncharacterized protein n=1 Tax=Meiothermus granaticius NBRC 107808 TaxID=1227551 RepID=A0A399F803_9DEIN|nr:hypothetical protein [Meiothermus granaticius]RIH91796.1 hypothetical protein Mgrana_02296 [Meiothermus granaticius NBRC 107808]GEM87900.1 hypothetical protein MGR01S_25250 [Meiothermus granaticius NBRC 107808]